MKNVYGYIRVSTTKQGEGVSLIAQKEAITRYAAQNNLEITQWFEEKETAAKLGRPLFNAMMSLLKVGKASGVIIHKIDRGARNLKDWADLGNLIDKGIEVHFAHESLDLQARGGRLSADIQAVIAADYIRNLRQEAIKGIYGRLKQGVYPFQAPIGYLNTGKGKFKSIDPIQAPLVVKAFELYATKKYTLTTLAEIMHELGLKNLNKKKVDINRLSVLLHNPFYIGIIKVKGMTFSGGHEPLISSDLFKRVQAILKGNDNQKVIKHNFKFRKLISCKSCGYRLIGELQKGIIYYRCHTQGCITKGIKEATIDNHLLKAFSLAQLFPEEHKSLHSLLQETEKEWSVKQQALVSSVRLQAAQIDQRLERLTDCYIEGGLDKETFEKRKMNLFIEKKANDNSEPQLLDEKGRPLKRLNKFLELSTSLVKSYQSGILEEQRELIEIATSNLQILGKNLIITMQNPFEEFSERFNFSFGAPERDAHRKKNRESDTSVMISPLGAPERDAHRKKNREPDTSVMISPLGSPKRNTPRIKKRELIYSDINTSPIIGEPLSKKQLKHLLMLLLEHAQTLPDNNHELEND